MKIVFMGTPDFAARTLQALHEAHFEIVSVVTQPDKPKGRGKEIIYSPVKTYALAHGITVYQPEKVRYREAVERLHAYAADVFVVAAFGQILPKDVLEIPPLGCINIHASLLPKLRGAAPIQQAIIDGEEETGITIMQMDEGCDTGDILYQVRVPIDETDTGGSLFDKLADAGARAIVHTLPLIADGALTPVRQQDDLSTLCGKMSKEAGHIDWRKDALSIARLVRAVNPWPCAYTTFEKKTVKIWEAVAEASPDDTLRPGTILLAAADGIRVQTGNGALRILSLQAEGKKRMDAAAFLNGARWESGMTLGG